MSVCSGCTFNTLPTTLHQSEKTTGLVLHHLPKGLLLKMDVSSLNGSSSSACAEMSKWLNDGEVLVGQGSGEAVPVSPRPRSIPNGSPMPGRARSPLASPGSKETGCSPQAEVMGKAKQLFVLCDKEGKGFITKRDMQVSSRWAGVQRCPDVVLNRLSCVRSEVTGRGAAVPRTAGGGF